LRVVGKFPWVHGRLRGRGGGTEAGLFHLRTEQGRQEIDPLAEVRAGSVIGIEVKVASASTTEDAGHLA